MVFWWESSGDLGGTAPSDRPAELVGQSGDYPPTAARRRMVDEQLRSRDITDSRVLAAMGRVAREHFVPTGPAGAGLSKTIRCRSASARRSRSPTSWR